ncbi:hypothetical protein [Zavarzinia aquatilis]|uniref:hypothetical protein n=1 Tax=Zavarzinia aquatilis TaxID=2211142 RepID=UPI001401BEB8|nr:hypothetical protein [Zavarzinia aquatilis]
MTIRDMGSGKVVTGVLQTGERGKTYRKICSRLTENELAAIREALDSRIDGKEIETSSWIPGSDWKGTPYQAIYEQAAKMNPDLAALMFGLLVWEAFERDKNDWYTDKFSMGGEGDRFRVYFRSGK